MRLELIDPRGLWAVYEDGKTGDDWTFATWEGKAKAEERMKSPEQRIADLERQLAEAQATIAALQWTEITPENFPKVGDEAYSDNDGDFLYVHTCDLGTAKEWTNEGWTHFRPISPPAQDSATEAEQ